MHNLLLLGSTGMGKSALLEWLASHYTAVSCKDVLETSPIDWVRPRPRSSQILQPSGYLCDTIEMIWLPDSGRGLEAGQIHSSRLASQPRRRAFWLMERT